MQVGVSIGPPGPQPVYDFLRKKRREKGTFYEVHSHRVNAGAEYVRTGGPPHVALPAGLVFPRHEAVIPQQTDRQDGSKTLFIYTPTIDMYMGGTQGIIQPRTFQAFNR